VSALLAVDDLRLSFGGVNALNGASLAVEPGTICGLIGPNGAGKTSLFNCATGLYRPSAGDIVFGGHSVLGMKPHEIAARGMARTFQNLGLIPSLTVLENVVLGAYHRTTSGVVSASLATPGARRERKEAQADALALLASTGLEAHARQLARDLPYPTLKRVELARALAARPQLLMLDEPAGGLSHVEVDQLAETIVRIRDDFDLTIVLVEHHMGLVMGISQHVVVLNYGRTIASGEPSTVRNDSAVIEAYLGSST
jgi:branched-chain amino acid transport system ATP-binding protein